MTGLTEKEILDQLKTQCRLAAQNCDKLAAGERGLLFIELREQLKLAEGCCRQMAAWREDTRWLPLGLQFAEAQKRSGEWLRAKEPGWRFAGLGDICRMGMKMAHDLETKATGRRGTILPVVKPLPDVRQGRPVSIILPPGYQDSRAVH